MPAVSTGAVAKSLIGANFPAARGFIKGADAARPGRQWGSFGMENREMSRLFNPRQFALGATLAAGALLVTSTVAEAQSSRMRVLIPSFEVENPRSKTGERIANELKKHINQMATHAPVDDKLVRDQMKKFGLKAEEMGCVQWRQLATYVDAALVLCGTIDETSNQVTAAFYNLGGDSFEVPSFAMQNPDQAAQHVVQAFGTYTRQLSLTLFCQQDIEAQSWEQALDRCNQAVELNPRSVPAHYNRGSALANLDRPEEALEAFERVLAIDELSQEAMLHAGLLSAQLGRTDKSQQYFARYLELNPDNEQVRLKIATDLANAGDPQGALRLLEEVVEAGNATGLMLEYAGHFAMNAGLRRAEETPANGNTDEANRLYQIAIRHYDAALQARGDSIEPQVYRNLMLAHHRLGERDKALQYGQRATQVMADDANTWLVYGEVLSGANRMDDALRAFDRAQQINPSLPNISARKASMLLEAGRLQEAVATARTGMQRGELGEDVSERLAQQMAVKGFQATQANRHDQALPFYAAAREVGKSARTVGMINFFHGYTLLKQAEPIIRDGNNAAAGRRALPLLQQSRNMLESAAAYTEQAATRAQLIQQVGQFIEVADALIKAGR
jgi:tetratricopeptide (TPR) repeat protein